MYKRLLLTYLDKYKRLDTQILEKELKISEQQIVDMVYSLKKEGYIDRLEGAYLVTEEGRKWTFPIWNEWSDFYGAGSEVEGVEFVWDYLYIPQNMI